MDIFQRHSYAICYKASMIKWLTSQSKTKILHFIWRRNARWLPNLSCGKKFLLIVFHCLLEMAIKSQYLFIFGLMPSQGWHQGWIWLCSVQSEDVGAEWYSLLWRLKPNLSEKVRESKFPSCIKCIKLPQFMILYYIIKAKLQGSRWSSDVISPPKSVGKAVILTTTENKFWWLQSRGFSKAKGYKC